MAGLGVVALIVFAIYDLSTTAAAKDQQVQESELKGQLAQFLLGTREPDGTSLLENPADFSMATRALQVVSLRRPFFAYLLNVGNARSFKAADISWEPPRACLVEFSKPATPGTAATSLQACFAVIPGDHTGRYVYFSLRYPTSKIRRHVAGRPLTEAHHVALTFSGQREVKLTLAFQVPPLARVRYPSQIARFDSLHELAGFLSEDGGKSTRFVNGQAFERVLEEGGNSGRNFVTLVGRINATMLQPSLGEGSAWPSAAIKALSIGARLEDFDESSGSTERILDIAPGVSGTPLVSIAQAYIASVPSRALLQVTTPAPGERKKVIWTSEDAGLARSPRQEGLLQRASDWWTDALISLRGVRDKTVSARQPVYVAGRSEVIATLTAAPIVLPDIATRAFTWLSLTLAAILVLWAYWFKALIGLQRITGTAYAMIVHPSIGRSLSAYAERRDEVGTLGRVFHLLITRNRSRGASLLRRQRQEENRRVEGLRLAEAHVQTRKAILDAIGHEIRSPLQSLLTRTRGNKDVQRDLERVRRAVDALHEATSVEDGLRNGEIIVETHDLAAFLRRLASNLEEAGRKVAYVGPDGGVAAEFDSIQLEQILDNLIDNASRHRLPGTAIELRLEQRPGDVMISVFNQGQHIHEADLERIFGLGVTDSSTPEHGGLGLFASRIYALAMRATIHAENLPTGVALVIAFPLADSSGK